MVRLAVIPARGGSKRISDKNIRPFCGKPIIAYSIAAALESRLFDKVVVSTDSEVIADIARQFGAEVPFIRPAELADDFCGVVAVIKHAVEWYQQRGQQFDAVCGMYATAPMIDQNDLASGLEIIESEQADASRSITAFPSAIQRALKLNESNDISMFQPEHAMTRSQDLDEAYYDAAHFFWWSHAFLSKESPLVKGVVIPRSRVQDIDTEEDWLLAESLYCARRELVNG